MPAVTTARPLVARRLQSRRVPSFAPRLAVWPTIRRRLQRVPFPKNQNFPLLHPAWRHERLSTASSDMWGSPGRNAPALHAFCGTGCESCVSGHSASPGVWSDDMPGDTAGHSLRLRRGTFAAATSAVTRVEVLLRHAYRSMI